MYIYMEVSYTRIILYTYIGINVSFGLAHISPEEHEPRPRDDREPTISYYIHYNNFEYVMYIYYHHNILCVLYLYV